MVSVRFGWEEKTRNDGSDTVEKKVAEHVGEQGNQVTWFSS